MSDSSQPTISSIDLPLTSKSIDDILKDCMIGASGSATDTITITPGDMSYSYTTAYDIGGNTINITGASNTAIGYGAGAQPTYSIGSSGISTITLNGIDASSYTINLPVDWKDCFPNWSKVQDMCEQYPGLKIAFENFKVFYEMVKDDYDNPTPKK
jgi:hypothetical protein